MPAPSELSGSHDLGSGVFYVRAEQDGRAILFACSLCAICSAMVPTKEIERHMNMAHYGEV